MNLNKIILLLTILSLTFNSASAREKKSTWERFDDYSPPKAQTELSSFANKIYLNVLKNGLPRSTIAPQLIYSSNNKIDKILTDGEEIFTEYKKYISEARSEILITTFIWNNDEVWYEAGYQEPVKVDPARAIGEGLILAQERFSETKKLKVKICADQVIGSASIAKNIYDSILDWEKLGLDLKRVEIQIGLYRHHFLGNIHVKTLVVDGKKAIVTGANIQANNNFDERNWHDSAVAFEGPAAYAIMKDFDESWYNHVTQYKCTMNDKRKKKCKRIKIKREDRKFITFSPGSDDQGGVNMLVLTQEADGRINNNTASPQDQAWIAAMALAQKRLYVLSPNINDDAFIKGMINAAARGVEVKLITSQGFNQKFVGGWIGTLLGTGGHNTHVIYQRILPALKKITVKGSFEIRWYSQDRKKAIEGNTVNSSHAKIMIADDVVISGSGNMDTFAWNNSRELNVLIDDKEITEIYLNKIFLFDWERSVPIE